MCSVRNKGGSRGGTRREDNGSEDALLPGEGLWAWGGEEGPPHPGEGRKRVMMLVSRWIFLGWVGLCRWFGRDR